MPILYDYPRAPSPRRARILLAEKGIAHETRIVDLAAGEHQSDTYRAVNAGLTVPSLVLDDGAVLCDNAAIAAWAEATKPEPPLFGRDPLEKAGVASWHSRCEAEGLMAIAEAMRNSAPAMKNRALPGPVDYPQIPELAERGRQRLIHFLDKLESHLAGREFLAGGFSVADITGGVALDFARVLRIDVDAGRPNLAAWRARLASRPSWSL